MSKHDTRSDVMVALTTNYPGYCDEEVLQALATAGAFVALADGRVDSAERAELVSYVDQQELVPTISEQNIGKAFDDCVRQLEDRDGATLIAKTFRPLAGLSLASVVVRTAERVAAADRKISSGELLALKLIRLFLQTLPSKRSIVRLSL